MQEITIKYLIYITKHSPFTRNRGRGGESSLLSVIFIHSRKFVNLFLVFNRCTCSHQLLTWWDISNTRNEIFGWMITLLYFLIICQFLLRQFSADKRWIWSCVDYHLININKTAMKKSWPSPWYLYSYLITETNLDNSNAL